MSAFAKQQTIETLRSNIDSWYNTFSVSNEQAEAGRQEYKADKVRKYKIRLINQWRAKQK
jgi:hypothetical protein